MAQSKPAAPKPKQGGSAVKPNGSSRSPGRGKR